MKYIQAIYKENKSSFLYLGIIWAIALYFIFSYPKGTLVLYFNDLKSPILNLIFIWLTRLGEPIFCVFCCLLFLIKNWKKGVFLSIALILNTILVQLLKHFVFYESNRPYHFYKDELTQIEGVELHSSFSFPSGHTMAGFTLFFVLSILIKEKIYKIPLLILGTLTALSRVYLSQHFLIDITVASVLAVLCSLLYYEAYNKKINIA